MTTATELTATEVMRRKSRLFMIGAFAVAAIAFAVIAASSINKNLVYYWTPSDLRHAGSKAYGATIRLGGMVKKGSIHKLGGSAVEFDVKDATQVVHVKTTSVPPQMFRENIGVVVEGTMVPGGYFQSDRLMVSHNNEYRAPAKGHPVDRKELERLMKSTEGLEGK
ncbi:MAG: cytochrome c maturation protein CcmE [Acidobacteria bacterium]|nr:cytochrome c maturation protein CcmE [Acidobacteriota bacterium]MBV9475587.1 cytochrome c maturation protein CcmE [Acidobacteriota bacterium]